MSSGLAVAVAALLGLAAGGAFFGGLWISTRRLADARRRVALIVVSFLARSAVTLALLWLALELAGRWGIVAFLIPFTLVRIAMVTLVRRDDANHA